MTHTAAKYEMTELTWHAPAPEGSDVDVDLRASFTKDGRTVTVSGFYRGDDTYSVRFLPEEAGDYSYTVSGVVSESGTLSVAEAKIGSHGMVRAKGTHFQYEDGTWFYPFGTTVYALLHQQGSLIDQTMKTLSASPFNKVRLCVFPKHYEYNHNDPEFYAFNKYKDAHHDKSMKHIWDTNHPCFAFWDRIEARLRELGDMGIQADLILFHPYDCWGFSQLTREEALTYLDYAVRRLSAFPNLWWSLANEYDLMSYTMDDWNAIAHFIHTHDPYGHLLSNHQIVKPWDFANEATSHICLQLPVVDEVRDFILKYKKPMMIDECRYEGNLPQGWGNLSGFEMVNRFWKVVTQGGYCTHGEVFLQKTDGYRGASADAAAPAGGKNSSANEKPLGQTMAGKADASFGDTPLAPDNASDHDDEVLWWAKGGVLHGESPARIGFLKKIVESLPGPLTYGCHVPTMEEVREMKKHAPKDVDPFSFLSALLRMDDNGALALAKSGCGFEGKVYARDTESTESDDTVLADLKYFDTQCTVIGEIDLPDSGIYDIDLIDVWNMTRKTVLRGMSGHVRVPMPGQEGMALLALRRS